MFKYKYMVHKFCENHLTALYNAIKINDVKGIEKIEHQLTVQEECVACAYTFKSKGEVKYELLSYLKSQGFEVEPRKEETIFEHLNFWITRVAFVAGIYVIAYYVVKFFFPLPWSVIVSGSIASAALLIFAQFLN